MLFFFTNKRTNKVIKEIVNVYLFLFYCCFHINKPINLYFFVSFFFFVRYAMERMIVLSMVAAMIIIIMLLCLMIMIISIDNCDYKFKSIECVEYVHMHVCVCFYEIIISTYIHSVHSQCIMSCYLQKQLQVLCCRQAF